MARPSDTHAKIDLLRAAGDVFLESGLDKARVEDITARAGRSKGSFYLHFESKEDAFKQLVESFLARLADMIDCPLCESAEYDSVVREWHEKDVELFEYFWQNRAAARLLLQGGSSAQFRYMIDAFAERARTNTGRVLQIGVDRGYYRPELDCELSALAIAGAYDRVVRELVQSTRKPDLRAWAAAIQVLFLHGISRIAKCDS